MNKLCKSPFEMISTASPALGKSLLSVALEKGLEPGHSGPFSPSAESNCQKAPEPGSLIVLSPPLRFGGMKSKRVGGAPFWSWVSFSLPLPLPLSSFSCLPTLRRRMTHFFIRLRLLLIRTIINKAFLKWGLNCGPPSGVVPSSEVETSVGPGLVLASTQVRFKYPDLNFQYLSLMRRFTQGYGIRRGGGKEDKGSKVCLTPHTKHMSLFFLPVTSQLCMLPSPLDS